MRDKITNNTYYSYTTHIQNTCILKVGVSSTTHNRAHERHAWPTRKQTQSRIRHQSLSLSLSLSTMPTESLLVKRQNSLVCGCLVLYLTDATEIIAHSSIVSSTIASRNVSHGTRPPVLAHMRLETKRHGFRKLGWVTIWDLTPQATRSACDGMAIGEQWYTHDERVRTELVIQWVSLCDSITYDHVSDRSDLVN